MSLTPMPLYCPECGCQQIEAHKSYPVKAGGVRQLYYCPECKGYFSETPNTPLANLKTPLSRIVEILQALNEGLGVNAVCRVFGVSKNSLYRWQQRLSAETHGSGCMPCVISFSISWSKAMNCTRR